MTKNEDYSDYDLVGPDSAVLHVETQELEGHGADAFSWTAASLNSGTAAMRLSFRVAVEEWAFKNGFQRRPE